MPFDASRIFFVIVTSVHVIHARAARRSSIFFIIVQLNHSSSPPLLIHRIIFSVSGVYIHALASTVQRITCTAFFTSRIAFAIFMTLCGWLSSSVSHLHPCDR